MVPFVKLNGNYSTLHSEEDVLEYSGNSSQSEDEVKAPKKVKVPVKVMVMLVKTPWLMQVMGKEEVMFMTMNRHEYADHEYALNRNNKL